MTSTPRSGKALLSGGLAITLALTAACSGETETVGGNGDDTGSVSIALVPGWDEDVAVTYLWKELLEEKGYEVDVLELEIAAAFAGVANGQIDLYLDAWFPTTHESYWEELGDDLDVIGRWYEPAVNNLSVPEYMEDVNSLADLAEHADEFDNRIVGIESGAGLMRITREEVMPAYGLDSFELAESSTAAMLTELQRAVDAEDPIVVPLWQPHWVYAALPMKPLEDPEGAFGEPDTIDIVATQGFAEDQPDVARWMGDFFLTPDQLGELQLLLQDHGDGNEQEAAAEWIAQNQELADSWVI